MNISDKFGDFIDKSGWFADVCWIFLLPLWRNYNKKLLQSYYNHWTHLNFREMNPIS